MKFGDFTPFEIGILGFDPIGILGFQYPPPYTPLIVPQCISPLGFDNTTFSYLCVGHLKFHHGQHVHVRSAA